MMVSVLRSYSPEVDKPKRDFDKLSIDLALKRGETLLVNEEDGTVWTGKRRCFIGKIKKPVFSFYRGLEGR